MCVYMCECVCVYMHMCMFNRNFEYRCEPFGNLACVHVGAKRVCSLCGEVGKIHRRFLLLFSFVFSLN